MNPCRGPSPRSVSIKERVKINDPFREAMNERDRRNDECMCQHSSARGLLHAPFSLWYKSTYWRSPLPPPARPSYAQLVLLICSTRFVVSPCIVCAPIVPVRLYTVRLVICCRMSPSVLFSFRTQNNALLSFARDISLKVIIIFSARVTLT